MLFAALKSRSWALACCGAAALAFAPVIPWYIGQTAVPGDATRQFAKFFVSNVYFANGEHVLLRKRIAEENPDLVGLVEVTSAWIGKLESLRADYPYHFEVPDERLRRARALQPAAACRRPGAGSRAALDACDRRDRQDAGRRDRAHPRPPDVAAERRVHPIDGTNRLLALAHYVGASGKPVILAGDLNLTMWNDNYRPLVETGGLQNAREGHGVGPTWPSILPIGVPIDHILATREVALREFRVLRGVGSDHLPISAEFSLR